MISLMLTWVSSLPGTDSLDLLGIAMMLFYLPFGSWEQSSGGQRRLTPCIDCGGRPGWSLPKGLVSSGEAVFHFLHTWFNDIPDQIALRGNTSKVLKVTTNTHISSRIVVTIWVAWLFAQKEPKGNKLHISGFILSVACGSLQYTSDALSHMMAYRYIVRGSNTWCRRGCHRTLQLRSIP